MRRFVFFVGVLVVVLIAYAASFAFSLKSLNDAVRSSNGEQVLARTDVPRLRRSLTDQVVAAYLDRVGRGKPLQQAIANTYGASVADAILARFLTAENITRLLQTGSVPADAEAASWSMPPLSSALGGNVMGIAGRLRPKSLLEVELRLSEAQNDDDYSAVAFRLEGLEWKLSGLRLAKAVIRDVVKAIPAK